MSDTNTSDITNAISTPDITSAPAWDAVTEDAGEAPVAESSTDEDGAWGDITEDDGEPEEQSASDDQDDQDDEAEESEEDSSDDEDEVEKLDKQPEVTKVYKAKKEDGEVVEIPDNVIFKLKADGRFQEVTFKMLKDNYAGKVAWDERFASLSEKEKVLESRIESDTKDREVVNTYVRDVMANMQNADIPGAINALADLTGQDRAGMIRSMLGGMVKFYNELALMPAEQQERYILELENNAYRSKIDRDRKAEQQKQGRTEVANKLTALREQYSVSERELDTSWKAIKQAISEKKIFNGDLKQVTPEFIVSNVLDNRIIDNIETAASEAEVTLTPEDKRLIFSQLRAYVDSNGYEAVGEFELSDYVDFVKAAKPEKGVVKGQAAKNLSRKAKKNGKATPKTVKNKTKPSKVLSTEEAWDVV